MLLCFLYFSPLQVKNEPHDRVTKHVFILGPASLVANNPGLLTRRGEGGKSCRELKYVNKKKTC